MCGEIHVMSFPWKPTRRRPINNGFERPSVRGLRVRPEQGRWNDRSLGSPKCDSSWLFDKSQNLLADAWQDRAKAVAGEKARGWESGDQGGWRGQAEALFAC